MTAFLLLVLVWLIWGVSYPVTAIALKGFGVMTVRCLVQLLGAGALFLHAGLRRQSFAVEREAWRDLAISGLLNMAVLPVCFTLGVYLLGPGRTSILVYTMPIWASLLAWPMLGERLTRNRVAALFLAAAAIAVLLSQDLSHLRNAPLGAAITLVAAVAFGLGTVWFKRREWHAGLSVVVGWQILVGLVPMSLIWLLTSFPPDFARAGEREWLALLFLGAGANGLAYFAWFRVVQKLPAGLSSISALVVPCVGVVSSAWLTGERLHPRDLVAMAMILLALLLVLGERLRPGRWLGVRRAAGK
ncbi:MAG TPA: EamA family transporter [Stellaceae bacterium]|nr:EamA family transporter [Stellaceae bacterium]